MKNDFTPEQLAAWRRGEFCIEFCFDEPPQVNQQDFEKWVQERKIKPNLVQVDTEWTPGNTQTIFSQEVKSLSDFPETGQTGHCIK